LKDILKNPNSKFENVFKVQIIRITRKSGKYHEFREMPGIPGNAGKFHEIPGIPGNTMNSMEFLVNPRSQ